MNKEPLRKMADEGKYLKIVEHLINEVEHLETLLATERLLHAKTKHALEKAEHDRDRYAKKCEAVYEAISGGI